MGEEGVGGNRKHETSEEAPAVVQVREDGPWLRGDGGGGETWAGSRCIVHVKLTAIADGLEVGMNQKYTWRARGRSQAGLLPVWHAACSRGEALHLQTQFPLEGSWVCKGRAALLFSA